MILDSNKNLNIQNPKTSMFEQNWNLVSKIEVNSENNNYYCALNLKNKILEEKSFLIIKSIDSSDDDDDDDSENVSTNKYELHIGDVLKLGRVPLKIRNLCVDGEKVINTFKKNKNTFQRINTNFTNNNNNNNNNENIINNDNEMTDRKISSSKKKKTCRVCYCDDIEVNSPLITPCKCIGGLKYIHLKCLQNWIHAQSVNLSEESNDFCLVYNVKQLSCEICKEKYPDFIYLNENDNNNNILDIFDFVENKFKSYVILESYFKNNFKNIFVLSCDSHNVISIGRSHETNLKINDITVSRFHSEIIKENNKFYIRDLYSKFGTGILLQNNKIKIKEDFPLYIQIGKNIMEIKIEKKCFFCYKIFNCLCFKKNFNNKIFNYYGKENAEKINIENVFDFQEINENNIESDDNSSMTSINKTKKEEIEDFHNNNNNNKIIQIQNNNESENNNNVNSNDFDNNNKLLLNNTKNLTINTNSSNHNLTTLTMSMNNSTQNKNRKMKKINITNDLGKNTIKNKLINKNNNNDDIMEEDFKESDLPNEQLNDCIQIYNNNTYNSNRELLKDISINNYNNFNNNNNNNNNDKNNDD